MNLNQLTYTLPEKNIAHSPTTPRDSAKLLVLDKETGEISHKYFFDLPNILSPNDVLVFNETKVFPARIYAKKSPLRQGFEGQIELLLLNQKDHSIWTAMHKGKVKTGQILQFGEVNATILDKSGYEITLQFNKPREEILKFIEQYGQTPLPPYIDSSEDESKLREEYQTVYAKHSGSVAAPTAGLHFTKELIQLIKDKGVQMEYVTLHVGAGTFLPIKEPDITKHNMHSEVYSIEPSTLARLNEAKIAGKRIISVGTTTTRVLETVSNEDEVLNANSTNGATSIYIFPPYKFKFVDALITNFHLPHSTLLALVSAFTSEPNTKNKFSSFVDTTVGKAYLEAIKKDYRFYSFGDGMIIL